MHRILAAFLAIWCVITAVALAQVPSQLGTLGAGGKHSAGGAYTGPGDIVASASGWWGFRAYNAAYATGTHKAVNICNVSDVACADMSVNSSGNLVITTVGGSDCSVVTCTVKIIYDQSGALNCSAAVCDLSQATISKRATFVTSCLSGLPCMTCSITNATQYLTPGSGWNIGQPFSLSSVYKRSGNFTTSQTLSVANDSNGSGMYIGAAANTLTLYAGTVATVTASDGNNHAVQAAYVGGNSTTYVDSNGASGPSGVGSFSLTIAMTACYGVSTSQNMNGNLYELGWWPVGFTSTQAGNLNSNQHTYWGF